MTFQEKYAILINLIDIFNLIIKLEKCVVQLGQEGVVFQFKKRRSRFLGNP